MEEEMILKMSFCSKSWFDKNADLDKISDSERLQVANVKRGVPCIAANENYPEIIVFAVFPDCKEISLSDDIYPNVVEMASILKEMEGVSDTIEVSFCGVDVHDSIKGAIIEVLKLLIPRFNYTK